MYLQDFMWKLFQSTGAISAYLAYRQIKSVSADRLEHLRHNAPVDVVF